MARSLNINTTDSKKIIISFNNNGKVKKLTSSSTVLKSQATLPLIEKLLQKEKVELNQIDEVKVDMGYGSFTGLRVGISIANALGYLLRIPVNGNKIGELERPVYNK